jgi:uncharacterized membrane protein
MSESMTLGPMQMLVVSFEGNRFRGEILPELRRLREHDIVRLIDLLVVARDLTGDVEVLQKSDLTPEEAQRFGAVVGTLIGLGAGGDAGARAGAEAGAAAFEHGVRVESETVWDIAGRIPVGSSAAIVLLEHRWAIPLRDAIGRAQGISIVDEWVGPEDLIAAGLDTADLAAAASAVRAPLRQGG